VVFAGFVSAVHLGYSRRNRERFREPFPWRSFGKGSRKPYFFRSHYTAERWCTGARPRALRMARPITYQIVPEEIIRQVDFNIVDDGMCISNRRIQQRADALYLPAW
jgi:hypothetical protein